MHKTGRAIRLFYDLPGRAPARTNRDRTCLWCGQRLRRARYATGADGGPLFGDYGDGAFCGLRCGYTFGVLMAANGYRLQPSPEKGLPTPISQGLTGGGQG